MLITRQKLDELRLPILPDSFVFKTFSKRNDLSS